MSDSPPTHWRARLLEWASERRTALAYGAFTLIVFLVATVYLLPHETIARRVIDEATVGANVQVDFSDVSFAVPNGYHFADVRVLPDGAESAVRVTPLTVRVPLTSLLSGQTGAATFTGGLASGAAWGWVEQQGARVDLDATLERADLTALAAPWVPAPGRLGGLLDLNASLRGLGKGLAGVTGQIRLGIQNLAGTGLTASGFTIPDLSFDEVTGRGEVQKGRLQIDQLRARGEELVVTLTGDILLRQPSDRSVLNLRLGVDVLPAARDEIKMLGSLLPSRKSGQDRIWNLRGTIARPSLR